MYTVDRIPGSDEGMPMKNNAINPIGIRKSKKANVARAERAELEWPGAARASLALGRAHKRRRMVCGATISSRIDGPVPKMIPIPFELFLLPVVALVSAWGLGIAIARFLHAHFFAQPAGKDGLSKRQSSKPFLSVSTVIGAGIAAMTLSLLAGALTLWLCYSFIYAFMDVPPHRIEPANFAGGPTPLQVFAAIGITTSVQISVSVLVWNITYRKTAAPNTRLPPGR